MATVTSFSNSSKSHLKDRLTAQHPASMYSIEGASFQEWALRILDSKGSIAHKAIGSFVTAINAGRMTIGQAEAAYLALIGTVQS